MKLKIHFLVFSFFLLFQMLLWGKFCYCQEVVNYGGYLVIKEGAYLVIGGNYFNKNDGISDGKIYLDGNILLNRNWVNYSNSKVLEMVGNGPVGNVIMNGTTQQAITGYHPSIFENLVLENSKKVLNVNDCEVNDTMVLDAVLVLNSNKIKLLNSQPAAIKYKSNYILSETSSTDGLGEVEWHIGQEIDTYEVPFGSGIDTTTDLTVTLTTKSMGYPLEGSISFATYPTGCQNFPLPTGVEELDRDYEYIADRYWLIDAQYEEKPGVSIIMEYRMDDLNTLCNGGLKESEMKAIRYNLTDDTWSDMDPTGYSDPSLKRFYINDVSPENFYAPWCLVDDYQGWELFFPNAFTPNGDGVNDFFSPVGINLEDFEIRMYIYDRWGGLIYEMEDIDHPWDGHYGTTGAKCPQGIYTWIMFLKDRVGKEYDYTGIVALIK